MTKVVLLDAGPLSLVTHPRAQIENRRAAEWLAGLRSAGITVRVPEIADYEVRRELLRAGKLKGLGRLDDLKEALGYLPLTTEAMLQAAQFWADARNQGRPTASDLALDADVILAAQAVVLERGEDDVNVVVATTNVGHLSRFVSAKRWEQIDQTTE
ncbi:MAG: nuclease [Actinobacteria bacterium]|nr:nuclease [Actinomycetota bacterium]